MTLDSRRYEVFRRLTDKLLIEDAEAKGFPPAVSRVLTPTIDVSDLLLATGALNVSLDLSGGSSSYVPYMTVPKGERWFLVWAVKEATTMATHMELNIAKDNINFQLFADTTTLIFFGMSIFILEEDDSIGLIETGDPADSDIFVSLLFQKELTG